MQEYRERERIGTYESLGLTNMMLLKEELTVQVG